MSRAVARGHAILAGIGVMLLLAGSRPIGWDESRVATDQWDLIAVVGGACAVLTGVIAGALDGTLLRARSRAGLAFALCFDTVLLVPMWSVSAIELQFLQVGDANPPLDSVLAPVGSWLLGVLLLHLVSAAVVGELDRMTGDDPIRTGLRPGDRSRSPRA